MKTHSNGMVIEYDGIQTPTDYDKFSNEIRIGTTNNNAAGSYGIVYSPYFTIKVQNDNEVTPYCANVVQGLSSFAYIKLNENSVTVNVKFYQTISSVKFYCVGNQPTYQTIDSSTISVTLTENKPYTICINNDLYKCLTLFTEKEVNFERGSSNVTIYKPGVHDYSIELKENESVYFAKGVHYIRDIVLNNNTQVYFEDGAYIHCINPSKDKEVPTQDPDWQGQTRFNHLIRGRGLSNVRIYGHGIIDSYDLSFHARLNCHLLECNNVSISDILFNNPSEWCIDIACCQNVNINNVKIFGYRQNSDGICLEDCKNALVENCFARTGDDVFEVKSRYSNCKIEIGNIRFTNCVAWPEKARGLGIISETKRHINDCKWENCIVVSYIPKWMQKLGACVIIGESTGEITNIEFNNIKIFNNVYFPINVTLGEDSTNKVDGVLFKNIYFENEYNLCVQNDSTNGIINNITFDNVYTSSYNVKDNQGSIIKNGAIGTINIA